MPAEKIPVGKISSSHISKQIAVEGRINKVWPVKSKLINGAFQCQRCEHITFLPQPFTDNIIKPYECANDVCGRKGPFKVVPEESEWIDEQKLELQDLNEAKQGHPEKGIIVLVRGEELIETVPAVNAQVVITGTVRIVDDDDSSIFDKVLEANHIEIEKDAEIPVPVYSDKLQREKRKVMKEIIRELQEEHKSAVSLEDIVKKAEEAGIKRDATLDLIMGLKTIGELLEVTNGRFRVV